jgi:hypothetical protein
LREDGLATASATHHGGKLCLARLALPETLIEEWIFDAHRDTAACIQRCDYCMELQRYDLSDKRQRFRLNRRAVHVYEKPISILPRVHAVRRCHCAALQLSSQNASTRCAIDFGERTARLYGNKTSIGSRRHAWLIIG